MYNKLPTRNANKEFYKSVKKVSMYKLHYFTTYISITNYCIIHSFIFRSIISFVAASYPILLSTFAWPTNLNVNISRRYFRIRS